MKKIISIIGISLFILSCSNDESSNNSNTNDGSQLRKVEKYSSGFLQSTTTYEYFQNGNIKKITFNENEYSTTITDFYYDTNNEINSYIKTKSTDFGSTTDTTEEIFNFTFNGANNISDICIDGTRTTNSPYEYVDYYKDKVIIDYNSSNLPVSFEHYSPMYYPIDEPINCSDVNYIDFTENLNYTNNNMTYYYAGNDFFSGNNYYVYEYDNKNHPMKNIKPDCIRNGLGFSTNNNILKGYAYNYDTNELKTNINYTYEYNSSNYPTKLLISTTSTGSGVLNSTVEYRYYYN